jgi:hypothetical protein
MERRPNNQTNRREEKIEGKGREDEMIRMRVRRMASEKRLGGFLTFFVRQKKNKKEKEKKQSRKERTRQQNEFGGNSNRKEKELLAEAER